VTTKGPVMRGSCTVESDESALLLLWGAAPSDEPNRDPGVRRKVAQVHAHHSLQN